MLDKRIRVRQGLWNEIRAERNISMRKEGYVVISRPPVMSLLKRYGTAVGAIDIKPSELPLRVRKIAEDIVKSY